MSNTCAGCAYLLDRRHIEAIKTPDGGSLAIHLGGLYCRRYPREVEKNRDDWCGEYKAKPSKDGDKK